MPRARKNLVCVANTPYYHVTSRCVRRAFLCGFDSASGKSYEHRRDWIESRIRVLSSIFSISICAYAVMSNHYHLVVRLQPSEARIWSRDEVISRWTALFKGPLIVQRYRAGEALSKAETETLHAAVEIYRSRLTDLSWFMKCLNEPIARKANAEDDCRGHFWEARFFSQALLTERALFAAMAYVDLNPMRAGIACSPGRSHFTSIRARGIDGATQEQTANYREPIDAMSEAAHLNCLDLAIRPLMPFSDQDSKDDEPVLPLRKVEYERLIEISAQSILRTDFVRPTSKAAPTLSRLDITIGEWVAFSTKFQDCYRTGDLRQKRSA